MNQIYKPESATIEMITNSKDLDIALTREAAMSSMALGIGLTHIRKYNYVQQGYFYSAIYSYSTGLERLLKLILIYDYRLNNNNEFPNNKQIRACGHNLSVLVRIARTFFRNYFRITSH